MYTDHTWQMASSFRKKGSSKSTHLRGTRPSLHNTQLLVSTGVPSLDVLLGGGLAVGTVLLVEEDVCGSYSRLLLKYFLAEGVMCGHSLLLASASENPEDIVKDLPGSVEVEQQQQHLAAIQEDSMGEEQMKIAWRYQNQPKVQSSFSTQFGHFFDLTTHMDPARLEAVTRIFFSAVNMAVVSSSAQLYNALRESILTTVNSEKFSVDEPSSNQSGILRVGVQSMGSPLWLDEGDDPSLPQFLHALRGLLRKAHAVAVLTVPTHLMQDSAHVSRLERLSDAVIHLESFAGSEKEQNPLYRDYHGLFHLRKIPRLNSLVGHFPETMDLAFKLKKKKFLIEKLHLPPELSETASRSQEDTKTVPLTTADSRSNRSILSLSKKIDF
ncbi:elongator complex protein 4-like [Halichondria panicea]|uniref:elongator complex protein 4-like n=1 Tax=Halichondria panicea TaxID=6063 RepID=UPI00312B53E8